MYAKLLKRKLDIYKDNTISDLKAYRLSDNFVPPNDAVRLVVLKGQLEAKLSDLENVSINSPSVNIKDLIYSKFQDSILHYKNECSRLKDKQKYEIDKLYKEKDNIIKSLKEDLNELIEENNNQLSPYISKHGKLKEKREELENIFRLYCIECNGFNVEKDISLNELDDLFDLANYGLNSVLRDKRITSRLCELMYLPLVVNIEDKLTSNIFSIVYFLSLILACIFCKPVLSFISVVYIVNAGMNVSHVLQRKELLQMAYAISEDVDFSLYIEDTDEIMEVRESLEEAIDYDLSSKIESITKGYEDKINALENPEDEMESELTKATVAMSDGVISNEINKVVNDCLSIKEDLINSYSERIDKIVNILDRIPKDVLGDDIIESDLLQTKMRIGSVNVDGKPVSEVSIDIPFKSIGFLYKDDDSRLEVLRYMKLILANYISNVNPKQLVIDVYDEFGLGSELSEFITSSSLNYIRCVTTDFNKLFIDIKTGLETNINSFSVSDIQDYNEKAIEVGKTTIKYRMLIIISGVTLESNESLMNFITEKTKQGLIVLFLYKDSTLFKDEPKQKLEDLYSKILVCRSYGKLTSPDKSSYGSVAPPAKPYEYIDSIGRKVMSTYNRLLKERSDPILLYKKDYQEKQISEDKFWTYNTLMGIEARFGYVDGDPTKPECHIFGDDTPHCLTVGRTGSGKSVFLNNALANMTLMYSPEWLTLCMIDFKNTEFFIFQGEASIPHAKLVAGTTDGEYAVSVFEYIDAEMKRRNDHFLSYGTKNIVEYNKAVMNGKIKDKIMPRMLFVIDEFQVMFNKVAPKSLTKIESAIVSLSKVARSAGCHLWFASQSMTGTMSEDILNQFKLRVALGCDEGLSNNILGNPAAAKIDRLGYSYSNGSGGTNPNANRYWRTPFIATDVFLNYLKELNQKCERENILKRKYKVFDEKEKFPSDLIDTWLNRPEIKSDKDLFILGETTCFSVNEIPPNFRLFEDNSENILFGTYEVSSLVNGINTFISNIKSKENTEIIINCLDKDIAILLGAEDKITPKYKAFLNNDIMNLDSIFTLLEKTLETRMTNPNTDHPRIFFIGIGWDKMDGLGENVSMKTETRFKALLDKCPKFGIHFIIANKDISEFRIFKKNFLHRIGSKLDSKSANIVEENDKLSNKEFMDHMAIYSTDASEVKFKLYQYPMAGELRSRELKLENYD